MNNLVKTLKDLEKYYLEAKNRMESMVTSGKEGSLIVKKRKGRIQYFHQNRKLENGKYERRYLNKNNPLINCLAQEAYNKKLIKIVKSRYYHIKHFNKEFNINEIDSVYDELKEELKSRVKPVFPTWKQKLTKWRSKTYIGLPFSKDSPEIYTKKGERVRSKTEKIIADIFFDMKVEYKYECPLILQSGEVFYPDFTFLNPGTNEEVYWEHFGMMEDREYAVKTMNKIEKYEANGIYLGERLIITFESTNKSMNFNRVKGLVIKYLK